MEMKKSSTSVLSLLFLLSIGLVATACGDDPVEYEEPVCNEWDEDACDHDEICHQDDCHSISTVSFELEIIDGQASVKDEYWVGAVYRGDLAEHGFSMATTNSPPTTTPEWRETGLLDVRQITDWWEITMYNQDNLPVVYCEVDFDKRQFGHASSTWTCGDNDEYFNFEITPR